MRLDEWDFGVLTIDQLANTPTEQALRIAKTRMDQDVIERAMFGKPEAKDKTQKKMMHR